MRFDLCIRMKLPTNTSDLSIGREFSEAELGNKRRTRRLQRIAERLEAQPGKSLPQVLGSVSEREATYRFLNNENISFQGILTAHFEATAERARAHKELLCVHDVTQLEFGTPAPRKGLGRLRGTKSSQGFLAHTSLLVGLGECREPLGLLAAQPWTRTEQVRQMRRQVGRTEMDCWFDEAKLCEQRCQSSLIHVMDRQGDSYEIYHQLQAERMRFVVRACHDRSLPDGASFFDRLNQAPLVATSRRAGKARHEKHP